MMGVSKGARKVAAIKLAIKRLFFTMSHRAVFFGNVIYKPGCMPNLCILRKS